MTSYLVVTRAAIILWISLAVMPVALVFDSIEANWSAAASTHEGLRGSASHRQYRPQCLYPLPIRLDRQLRQTRWQRHASLQ